MAAETSFDRDMRGRTKSRLARDVAARAEAQHGVVSRAQLLSIGLSADGIDRRVAGGLLHPIQRGVYAVGHRPRTREASWMAAVLAAGPDAVLGGRFAAALWRLRPTSRSAVEVIAPRLCRRPGVVARRIVLPADERDVEHGIPVTTPARTLFDLAAVVPLAQLEHAFNEAEYRRLGSPTSLDALLARYPGRRGTANLGRVLDSHRRNGETMARSVLERELIALVDAHGLPRPRVNRTTAHGELDARWPAQRLVVECDGFAAHGTRRAFEDDRARDRALTVAGWRVIRVTWRQLTADGDTIARQIATLLAGRR